MDKEKLDNIVEMFTKAKAKFEALDVTTMRVNVKNADQATKDTIARLSLQTHFLRTNIVHLRQQTDGNAEDFLAGCFASLIVLEGTDKRNAKLDPNIAENMFGYYLSMCIVSAEGAIRVQKKLGEGKDMLSGIVGLVDASRTGYANLVQAAEALREAIPADQLTLTDMLALCWHVSAGAVVDQAVLTSDLYLAIGTNVGTLGLDIHKFMDACDKTFHRYMRYQAQIKTTLFLWSLSLGVFDSGKGDDN